MEYFALALAILVILVLGFYASINCINNYRSGYREKDSLPPVLPKLASPGPEIQKGLGFERFVASRFDRAYFKLKVWRGDKTFQGIYPESNGYPDLVYEYRGASVQTPFAVECKWRAKFFAGRVGFSNPNQLNNYRSYALERNLPVFLVIGIGGSESQPQQCYVVPLNKIPEKFNFLSENFLRPYLRPQPEKMFFLVTDKMVLK